MEHGITAAPARFWRTWASGLSRSLRVCCARGSARLYSPARCPGSRGQGKLEKRREADRGSSMPGATATPDVEVIVEDARGGGGGGGRRPDGGNGAPFCSRTTCCLAPACGRGCVHCERPGQQLLLHFHRRAWRAFARWRGGAAVCFAAQF